ncbi:hypothetical protein [Cohnella fermenti]|uniref:Uncharacterized protein n=1 Tax=Cohnella fermenti TaxID=2565925 RepID=A0A4S4C7V0_9BACL|nr:hypothetical protein [Cohnella fermenti]THF83724.1 hypothetical protein E6C55_03265 [Cohnella fermenti]
MQNSREAKQFDTETIRTRIAALAAYGDARNKRLKRQLKWKSDNGQRRVLQKSLPFSLLVQLVELRLSRQLLHNLENTCRVFSGMKVGNEYRRIMKIVAQAVTLKRESLLHLRRTVERFSLQLSKEDIEAAQSELVAIHLLANDDLPFLSEFLNAGAIEIGDLIAKVEHDL